MFVYQGEAFSAEIQVSLFLFCDWLSGNKHGLTWQVHWAFVTALILWRENVLSTSNGDTSILFICPQIGISRIVSKSRLNWDIVARYVLGNTTFLARNSYLCIDFIRPA